MSRRSETPRIQSTRIWIPNGRRAFSLVTIGAWKEKISYKIGIALEKIGNNDFINKLHGNAWIKYKKETMLLFNALSDDDDNHKNSVASPSMDKKGKDKLFFQWLTRARGLKCKLEVIVMIYFVILKNNFVLISICNSLSF